MAGNGTVARRTYAGRSAADRRAERRERLLDAGLELFGTAGYAAASIEKLCTHAGVSTRNFYEEFGSREDLLMALHDRIIEQAFQAVLNALSTGDDAPLCQRFELAVRAFVTTTASDPRWARLSYVEIIGVSNAVEKHRIAWRERWAEFLESEANRAVARGEARPRSFHLAVVALIGSVNELVHHWSICGGQESLDDVIAEIVRVASAAGDGPVSISAQSSAAELLRRLEQVAESSGDGVRAAAELFAECVRADGVIHAFGTGHSQGTALEVAGRAGGLIPTNRIALTDLVQFGGEDPSVLADPMLERRGDVAGRLYELAGASPQDLFVIASSSGVNPSVVEMAHVVKAGGHRLVAITSVQHSNQVTPRHSSGKRLSDLADVTLDNGAPFGDTLVSLPDGSSAGAVSSLTAGLLVQMVVADTVRLLLDSDIHRRLYVSNNVPGGHERNLALEAHYEGRLRRTAS